MNPQMLHARKSIELHKWCSFRFSSAKLELNASTNAATSYRSRQDIFTISNIIDLYSWIKKTSKWVSREIQKEKDKEDADSDPVKNLFRRSHCHVSRHITCDPRLLMVDTAKKAFVPKHEFLQFRGASSFTSIYNDSDRGFLRGEEEEEEADNIG